MDNEKKGQRTANIMTGLIIFTVIFVIVGIIFIINTVSSSGGGSSYKQKDALEKAYEKSITGEEMSPTEKREWDSYKDWESKQYDSQYYD